MVDKPCGVAETNECTRRCCCCRCCIDQQLLQLERRCFSGHSAQSSRITFQQGVFQRSCVFEFQMISFIMEGTRNVVTRTHTVAEVSLRPVRGVTHRRRRPFWSFKVLSHQGHLKVEVISQDNSTRDLENCFASPPKAAWLLAQNWFAESSCSDLTFLSDVRFLWCKPSKSLN